MTARSRSRAALLAGALAAVLALAGTELTAGLLPGSRSPLAAVADLIIATTPAGLVRLAIDTLGAANRAVLFGSMMTVCLAAGSAIGLWTRRWRGAPLAGLAPIGMVGTIAGLSDPLVSVATAVVAPAVGVGLGCGLLLTWPGLRTSDVATPCAGEGPPPQPRLGSPSPTRRDILVWSGSALALAGGLAFSGRALQARSQRTVIPDALTLPTPRQPLPPPDPEAAFDVDGLSSLLTPNERFYRIDTAFSLPRIDPRAHAVRVVGLVDNPFTMTYDELLGLADTEADVTLSCVSNEVGGDLIGTARWQGVPLERLLERAGVQPTATQIVGRAVDDWTAGFPVDVLDGRPALVAVGMNGEPLPAAHGFPVRLVVAGLYGYVSDTKWLSEIELTTFDAYDAYWIRRGWARDGPIKTQSRIDVPRPDASLQAGAVTIAGVAWTGEQGIAEVEVRIDEGGWRQADLATELSPNTWRQWRYRWEATPGMHRLRVRATDGTGQVQTPAESPPAPDGATGHHAVTVHVA